MGWNGISDKNLSEVGSAINNLAKSVGGKSSGHIAKSHPHSYFKRLHLKSKYAEDLLSENTDEVILQMIVCGNMEVVVEIVRNRNFPYQTT